MLDISPTLSTAYFLKEFLYSILDETNPQIQKKLFSDWIEEAMESEFQRLLSALKHITIGIHLLPKAAVLCLHRQKTES